MYTRQGGFSYCVKGVARNISLITHFVKTTEAKTIIVVVISILCQAIQVVH